jgi:Flp pilus assembly protein TadD
LEPACPQAGPASRVTFDLVSPEAFESLGMPPARSLALSLGLLAACAAGALAGQAPISGYAGRDTCAGCHAEQARLHAGSHHDLAMQPATAASVLGNFADAQFSYAGVTSTFFRRGDDFFVRTDGPDGVLREYRVAYTYGVDPLQQYLIEFPDGRLQVLGIAWDSRPAAAGGQRWYHLYPDDAIDFRDELHWTAPAQNWNYVCAPCHSTGLRRNYSAASRRFATEWSEIDVSCEACHGPAAAHVAWAKDGASSRDARKGFAADLAARGAVWRLHGEESIARLDGARGGRAQVETCGRCHARATQIAEEDAAGQALAQTHRLALLDAPLYHADGQIDGEAYEYGSFVQSRMYAAGVVCSDCHDPHSLRLRAEGNGVCLTCHRAATYDAPAHHHHAAGRAAAACVSCHMPARDYMGHDTRHDHGFRVPRPDLSVTLGVPNACNGCHRDRPPAWAADAVRRWYGPERRRGPSYAAALAAGRAVSAEAGAALATLIDTAAAPAIVRATALTLLPQFLSAHDAGRIERAVLDPDPLVRAAAVALLPAWPPPARWQLGAPLLADPVRSVRLAAVDALAGTPGASDGQRAAFARAAAEYRAAQMLNADRAEAWLNLGALDARLAAPADAEGAYRRALELDPGFAPAYANLADLYRVLGRDAASEATLRAGLARRDAAVLHHALGLSLIRQRKPGALDALRAAAEREPRNPRYAYVYAVALADGGRREEAIAVVERAHRAATGDRDLLAALVAYHRDAGNLEAASTYAQKLAALQRD